MDEYDSVTTILTLKALGGPVTTFELSRVKRSTGLQSWFQRNSTVFSDHVPREEYRADEDPSAPRRRDVS